MMDEERCKRLLYFTNRIAAAATLVCNSPLKLITDNVKLLCGLLDEYHEALAKEFPPEK
jgi:hypothetical protein